MKPVISGVFRWFVLVSTFLWVNIGHYSLLLVTCQYLASVTAPCSSLLPNNNTITDEGVAPCPTTNVHNHHHVRCSLPHPNWRSNPSIPLIAPRCYIRLWRVIAINKRQNCLEAVAPPTVTINLTLTECCFANFFPFWMTAWLIRKAKC